MARPLRFRISQDRWTRGRAKSELLGPLDANLGATMSGPWFKPPDGYEGVRFAMDNGDTALFLFSETGNGAYWVGNTETPSTLWDTDKVSFTEAPHGVTRWAERELMAQLHEEAPWLADYEHLSWFFLPVFLSKDGRETSRNFFREHAAGFPDASDAEALQYLEDFLSTGVLDDHRYEMASKLGTSPSLDLVRMSAAVAEFTVAKILVDAGYDVTPEIEVTTGHSLDFRADHNGTGTLVEVTRPRPPNRRAASTAVAAVRETAQTKTSGQLKRHGGGATLFVDCSSFTDDDWAQVRGEQPDVRHRPAVVFRARPSGGIEAYAKGSVPLDLDGAVTWV